MDGLLSPPKLPSFFSCPVKTRYKHLRNWWATGETLVVSGFSLGGVPSSLIKRETKEPNHSSDDI